MTPPMEWLLRYLELSLMLGVGYGIYRLFDWLARRRRVAGVTELSRLGRFLLVTTLLAPIAAHLLPAPRTSLHVPFTVGALAPDGAGTAASRLERSEAAAVPAERPAWRTVLASIRPWHLELLANALLAALVAGFAVSTLRLASALVALRRLLSHAVPLRRLGRVSIVVSDRVWVPFATSVFGRAQVVVPVDLLAHPKHLRLALRHEIQHLRGRDTLWAVALELLRLTFYWYPVARSWVRRAQELQELACDEALVRRGIPADEYGRCLLHAADHAVGGRSPLVASTAMSLPGHSPSERGRRLRRRIDMLFQYRVPTARPWSHIVHAAIAAGLVLASAYVAGAAWPTERRDDEAPRSLDEAALRSMLESHAIDSDVRFDGLSLWPSRPDDSFPITVTWQAKVFGATGDLIAFAQKAVLSVDGTARITELLLAPEMDGTRAAVLRVESVAGDSGLAILDHLRTLTAAEAAGQGEIRMTLEGDGSYLVGWRSADDCDTSVPCDSTDTSRGGAYGGPADQRRDAPDFRFDRADGGSGRLSDLRGSVVLVDFWASWCGPCSTELPHLKQVAEELGAHGLQMVGVSLDTDPVAYESFIADNEIGWPQRLETGGWEGPVASGFGARALPAHFLVDREGRYVPVPLGGGSAGLRRAALALLAE